MDTYITRICWNDFGWQKPSGSASKLETDTFTAEFGFGFEEWLFSPHSEIEGWRHGFVQGVNKSQKRLGGESIGLLFYTIAPSKMRYFVGEIKECQVLTPSEANHVHAQLEKNGTFSQMIENVVAINGNPAPLQDKSHLVKWALDIVNVRYQPHDLVVYDKNIQVPGHSKIWKYSRYQLTRATDERLDEWVHSARKEELVS